MSFVTGRFAHPREHHKRWFDVFVFTDPARFSGEIEIWFGQRWMCLSW